MEQAGGGEALHALVARCRAPHPEVRCFVLLLFAQATHSYLVSFLPAPSSSSPSSVHTNPSTCLTFFRSSAFSPHRLLNMSYYAPHDSQHHGQQHQPMDTDQDDAMYDEDDDDAECLNEGRVRISRRYDFNDLS